MRVKLLLLGVAYFLSTLDKSHATYKCYKALICVHDGKEKCGQDMTGQTRRFLDSCDMKEYNCLRDANFQKINREKCRNLPPIDNRPSTNNKINNGNKNEVIVKKSKGQFIYDEGASKGDGVDRESEENALDGENKMDDDYGENEEEKVEETGEVNQVTNEKLDGANIINRDKTIRVKIHPGQAAVINKYWCWRAKYCHRTGGVVCGRDRRLKQRRKFKTICDLYNHNCDEGHDFTATDMKFCKGY